MAPVGVILTPEEASVLQSLIERERRRILEQRKNERPNSFQSSDLYIAKIPTAGMPAISSDTPGTVECEIYKLEDGDLVAIDHTEDVINLSGALPADAYFPIARDKFGDWVVLSGGFGSGGIARLTSAMTAASGTTTRIFGWGTADTYKRNGSNQSTLVLSSITIYNSSAQTSLTDKWIQFKVDQWGTRWWDVADC